MTKQKARAGGFLYNPKKQEVFLHMRDGNTQFNPHSLAFFGGLLERNESPEECFQRELKEEINLTISSQDIIYLDDYLNKEFATYRHVFYVISDVNKDTLTLGEGAGFDWYSLDTVFDYKITEKTAKDLETFLANIQ